MTAIVMDRAMFLPALLLLAACGGAETTDETASPAVETMPAAAEVQEAPAPQPPAKPEPLKVYTYKVVQSFPHGTSDFTQGLFVADGVLYETTGRVGQSSLIRHDIMGDAEPARRALPETVFGEGSVVLEDKIYALTWRSGMGLIYDLETLEPEGQFPLEGEGWGLTTDGEKLIVSDGTNQLKLIDPETYEKTGTIAVAANGKPVPRLNELEYIDGEIWANVWLTEVIVRIEPDTGRVNGFVNLAGLYTDDRDPRDNVLNGIAWDAENERLFVTGKNWPEIHEIEIMPAQ